MTPFEEKYKRIYRKAYEYHQRHNGAYYEDDWVAAAEDAKQFTSEFEIALAAAIYQEIIRGE